MHRRADHRPPDWLVPEVALAFEIGADRVLVRARLSVERNGSRAAPLRLDGEQLKLLEVRVDGKPAAHRLDKQGLTLRTKGDAAVIETLVELVPGAEQRGLFRLDGLLVTQCEPQGFRRISFFPDRPDVRARWRVRIEAAAPVLLSNGNPAGSGTLADGRYWAEWDDPLPKPSYLFALAVGELHPQHERAGETELTIWTRQPEPIRTAHAMTSLKAAMAWDEARFGRRYDHDTLNLVAVRGYGFGAVEAPTLNIFDAGALLVDPAAATDAELDAVAAIVAHEYLHNWSGNRVTIRDWFELTLKEGLTVFREQAFCAGQGDADVKRIQDVKAWRAALFAEARAGEPHPPRPETVAALGDLYSATIYVQGAELVRMLQAIAGPEGFRVGLERYFEAHDGGAARCEDLVAAMGVPAQFARWYSHIGTPRVHAAVERDPAARRAVVTLEQDAAEPLLIPIRTALFAAGRKQERLLLLDTAEQRFVFDDIETPPLLSINRGFSAPVVLETSRTPDDLAWLAAHDDDPVARWDAMQELMLAVLAGEASEALVIDAVRALFSEVEGLTAETARLPAQWIVAERSALVDPGAIHAAWLGLREAIGRGLEAEWREAHIRAGDTPGGRALRSVALEYLVTAKAPGAAALALRAVEHGPSTTERLGALRALADSDAPERVEALAAFHTRWREHPNLLDQWFAIQAQSARADTVQAAPRLLTHPDFTLAHPPRLDAIAGGFAANHAALHHPSGQGYRFLADVLLAADRIDSRMALRLLRAFARWRRYEPGRAALMQAALARIVAAPASEALRARAKALLG